MKATIDKYGCLQIKAQTSIESYALEKWWDGYSSENGNEALSIDFLKRNPPPSLE